MALTVEQVKAESPETFAAIESAARDEGVQAERKRLMEIDNVAMPGYEEMVAKAKEEGISAADLAVKILAAEKEKVKATGQSHVDDGKELAESLQNIQTGEPDADAAELARLTNAFTGGAATRLPAGK